MLLTFIFAVPLDGECAARFGQRKCPLFVIQSSPPSGTTHRYIVTLPLIPEFPRLCQVRALFQNRQNRGQTSGGWSVR